MTATNGAISFVPAPYDSKTGRSFPAPRRSSIGVGSSARLGSVSSVKSNQSRTGGGFYDRKPLHDDEAEKEALKKRLITKELNLIDKQLQNSELTDKLPLGHFTYEEITTGGMLGSGSFACVREITDFALSSQEKNLSEKDQAAHDALVEAVRSKQVQVAIKHLRWGLVRDPPMFAMGAADFAIESHLLSYLDHPNLVKLRGLSIKGPRGLVEGAHVDFFLIVDRVDVVLDLKILEWKQKRKSSRPTLFGFRKKKNDSGSKKILLQQLIAGHDIAKALAYLHDNRILHRDIKPGNCGFDAQGVCKLFDLGLATELHSKLQQKDGLYKLRQGAGTMRYMAPEVKDTPWYNFKADVYSFCLVLHEILVLGQRFPDDPQNVELITKVVCGKSDVVATPWVVESWSNELVDLFKRGLSHKIEKRPTMKEVCTILEREIQKERQALDRQETGEPTKETVPSKKKSPAAKTDGAGLRASAFYL